MIHAVAERLNRTAEARQRVGALQPTDYLEDAHEIVRAVYIAMRDERYTVLTERAVDQQQKRREQAENRAEWAERDAESARRWAESSQDETRRIQDRLTFVYGVARAAGVSIEDLGGSTGFQCPQEHPTYHQRCRHMPGHAGRHEAYLRDPHEVVRWEA